LSSVHPIHYLLYTGLLLVLHPSLFIQSLSKNCLSFRLPFQRESVCKGKAFFRNPQFFFESFFEKIFGRFSEGVRLTLSRSLAHRKVRYSVQQSALSPVASALPVCHLQRLSLSKAVAKVQTFSFHATFTPYFFAGFFQVLA
jgi:hypothetical protein